MDKRGSVTVIAIVIIAGLLAVATYNYYSEGGLTGLAMSPASCKANSALTTSMKSWCAGGRGATADDKLNTYCSSKSSSRDCLSKKVGGKTCCNWTSGATSATTTAIPTTSTTAPRCGDGIVNQASEQCDGANARVCNIGGYYGNQSCTACRWNTCTITQRCGDGIINGNEQCDGANVGGKICNAYGYTGGELRCSSECKIDKSGCTPTTTTPTTTTACSAPPYETLVRCYNGVDHLTVNNERGFNYDGNSGCPSGYSVEAILGYVPKQESLPGQKPKLTEAFSVLASYYVLVYNCKIGNEWMTSGLACDNNNVEKRFIAYYPKLEYGGLGWAPLRTIYRCRNEGAGNEHFDSISANCEGFTPELYYYAWSQPPSC